MKSSIGEMSWKVSLQTLLEEPLETVALEGDKIGDLEDLRDLGERAALALTSLDDAGNLLRGAPGDSSFQDVEAATHKSQNVRIARRPSCRGQ